MATPAPPRAARARHVIYTFDDMTWAAAQARGMCFPQDQLVLALLDDPEVERLLVCDRPRSAPVKLAKDLVQRPVKFARRPDARLWQPLRLRRQDPTSIAGLERTYAAYDRRLRRVAERFGLHEPAIVTSQPLLAGFAELEWAGPVTLFASDDLAAHPDYAPWHEGIREAYDRVAARSRRVAAVSNAIIERIAPQGPTAVVPNGVDPEIWLRPDPPPAWLTELPGPRLLYIGTLDSRLDVEAVRAVARAWPEGTVALVGPLTEPEHLASLLAEPNVFTHGAVERRQVAALACAADACLVPHNRTPLTEAMSPLKLYEYLASGRPVVATDLEPVRRVEGPVTRVEPGGDFVAGVRAALAAGPVPEEQRQAAIAANSWASRSAEVMALSLSV
ncbi:MAG TPA: glycosyltransferase [Solirubrobacterales bacterium]|nr:glycosyltransferase [Solirubrobacterales bacterium]